MAKNIFLFHGEHTPQINATTKAWIKQFIEKYKDNYDLHTIQDSKDFSMQKLIIEANTVPLLCEKKLIIAKNILHHFQKEDSKAILAIPESTIVMFIEHRKINKTDKQLGTFQKKITVQQFDINTEANSNLLMQTLQNHNVKITPNQKQLILNQYEKQPNQILEISKQLAAYFHNSNIQDQEFFKLVDIKQEPNIFNFLDTIYKNKSQTLKQYKQITDYNQDPYKVLYMLIWHLKTLLQIKSGNTQNIKPFIVNKHKQTANKISSSQIDNLLQQILKIDQQSKTGLIKTNSDLILAIEMAIFQNT